MTDSDRRRAALRARERAAAQAIAQEAAFHQARVLLIVDAFSGRTRGIRGLARLARLDFVMRFPHVLDMLDTAIYRWPDDCQTQRDERVAADSLLARRRYGLWVDRYSLILGGLISRRLVALASGRVLEPMSTINGRNAAAQLRQTDAWDVIGRRAAHLHNSLNLSAERLDEILRPALRRYRQTSLEIG